MKRIKRQKYLCGALVGAALLAAGFRQDIYRCPVCGQWHMKPV